MEIVKFKFDKKHTKQFVEFGYKLYSEDRNYIPPLNRDLRKQLSQDYPFFNKDGNSHCNFIIYQKGKVAGMELSGGRVRNMVFERK